MTPALKHLFDRSQSGQSIIILAIGFVALIGFVGIVTDVSLLFVRYSTLRRAVDAAAVAAAGQMRRVADDPTTPNIAEDQSDSFANMNLAARQFIEFYGLNPSEVIVETCWVQDRDVANQPTLRDPLLCRADERKLVRVTAQIESPTTFFNLFGFRTIRLEAASTSETAVLDMVFIMDVSESMLIDTDYDNWQERGYGYAYLPPVLPIVTSTNYNKGVLDLYNYLSNTSHNQIILPPGSGLGTPGQLHPSVVTLINSVNVQNGLSIPTTVREIDMTPGNSADNQFVPVQCRVRYWPFSNQAGSLSNAVDADASVLSYYETALGGNSALRTHFLDVLGGVETISGATVYDWVGFVPQYNFYGCCNDPNQDGSMSDLLCQPFRTARDASLDFMERIDFIRGDRLAIVTFDRQAYVMDPFPGNDTAAITAGVLERDVFISDQTVARTVMTDAVGVRTEPSFYRHTTNPQDVRWDAFVSPDKDDSDPRNPSTSSFNDFAASLHTDWTGQILNHPVNGACPLQMGVLTYPYGQFTRPGTPRERYGDPLSPSVMGEVLNTARAASIQAVPNWYQPTWLTGGGYGSLGLRENPVNPVNNPSANVVDEQYDYMLRTYDYRASCAGTNIGAGLGMAATALGQLGRREGAVWIMVLLSDGAAGASAPAYRNRTSDFPPTSPRYFSTDNNGNTVPQVPTESWYGAFGLCPYGVQTAPGEIVQDLPFPFCSDIDPTTRNWCSDTVAAARPEQVGPNRIELTDDSVNPSASRRSNRCQTHYDVDDYARDWADYVAVRGINIFAPNASGAGLDTSRNDSDTLLPTIFTIAFGLEFSRIDGDPACIDASDVPPWIANPVYRCNIESFLGEELLRYIADAGDNFRIDNDYWQNVLGYRIPNQVSIHFDQNLPATEIPDWGPPGPCEQTSGPRGSWRPLTAGEDCGNYWAASTGGNELEQVFAEIAARMFTRLSG
jgi:Flp pilus assembly protein TadG